MNRFLITFALVLSIIPRALSQHTAPTSEDIKKTRNFDIPADLKWVTGISEEMQNNKALIKAIKLKLPTLKTTSDSILALYDLCDLSSAPEKLEVAKELYITAKNAHDYSTQLDVLRLMATQVNSDSSYTKLIKEVKSIPVSNEQRETDLYIRLRRESFRTFKYTEEEKQARLIELIAADKTNPHHDKYQNVLRLYTICEVLRTVAKGDLLTQYLQKLETAMKEADFQLYSLQNIFLTTSANLYTVSGDSEKAIEADKRLLDVIDRLEQIYRARGRKYRRYCYNRFIIYRRMLVNFKALSIPEVEKIYDNIMEAASYDEDVYKTVNNSPRLAAFYLMAHNRNDEAIPLLRLAIGKETSLLHKRLLLELLEQAGKKTNNEKVVVEALGQYNDLLEYLQEINTTEKFNELRILYEVSELQNENNALELENRNNVLFSQRRLLNYIIVGWVLIIALLIFMLIYYTRYRRLSATQEKLLQNLYTERMSIMDAEFEDYDRHLESAGLESRKARSKGHKAVKNATDMKTMVEYMINDTLCVASISKHQRNNFIKDTTTRDILCKVEDASKGHIPSDIKVIIDTEGDSIPMHTDVSRVESVLVQLLRMLVKHSRNCRIKLSCAIMPDKENVKFTFHADGMEFNADDRELKFFDKFISVEQLSEYDKPGLLIGRLMTLLVHSEVKMRRTPEGRKVSFITPINLE